MGVAVQHAEVLPRNLAVLSDQLPLLGEKSGRHGPTLCPGTEEEFFRLRKLLSVEADVVGEGEKETQLWFAWVRVAVFLLHKLACLVGFGFVKPALKRVGCSTLKVVEAQTVNGY